MELTDILTGDTAERAPRADHLMTEAEARHVLRQIDREMPKSRRGATVRRLAESPHGRLSDAARTLYRAYAEAYGA